MYNPQLETFLKVADAGSFNKAAEEAYITPTAVIKQINLLEDSLGVKLFERTHRGLYLTKAGQSFVSGYKIHYSILQGLCNTGKECNAGGWKYHSHRNVADDARSVAYTIVV